MGCVNFNPIRAGIAKQIDQSPHTSTQQRIKALKKTRSLLKQGLQRLHGISLACLLVRLGDYIELADWTGKQVGTNKRGGAAPKQPTSPWRNLQITEKRRTPQVKGTGSIYRRAVSYMNDLLETSERLKQR